MGRSNQDYIAKADTVVSNLSSGGLLLAEQAKSFIELTIEDSVLLGMITTVPMKGPTHELSKVGFTSRVLRPATEGRALSEGDRSSPTLSKVTLSTKEVIAEARMSYSVLEDNIEQGTFEKTMLNLLSKAVARDLEDLAINGDTTNTTDKLLAMDDGFLKLATTNVVNASGVRLSKAVLKPMVQSMPSKYMKDKGRLAFLTSKNAVIDYSDSLAGRATLLGDDALVKNAPTEYMGYPVIPIPLFPENQGVGANMTSVLFCDVKNLHFGIQREIRIDTDVDISARQYIIVATLRVDVNYQHEPAVVKATNVLATVG